MTSCNVQSRAPIDLHLLFAWAQVYELWHPKPRASVSCQWRFPVAAQVLPYKPLTLLSAQQRRHTAEPDAEPEHVPLDEIPPRYASAIGKELR